MKTLLTLFTVISVVTSQQRVAPGVPPQHYVNQQQVPQMQQQQQHLPVQHQQHAGIHQQIPQQGQQVPVQHQQQMPVQHQVPIQHQQIPVQHQVPVQQMPIQHQVPVQQIHHGHHPQGQQLLNTANIAHEKEHIQEHMEVPMDTSNMSEQELQFHYFKMHDADNNNKLDGCELIKSLIHWHEQGHQDPSSPPTPEHIPKENKIFRDEELVQLIDPILSMDDGNRDGFIDYPEFVRAQQKAAVANNSPRP